MSITIQPRHTALIVIDLQKGIVSRPSAPHESTDIVRHVSSMMNVCRAKDIQIFLVRVTSTPDEKDRLNPFADEPTPFPTHKTEDWSELVPELHVQSTDIIITKRQWGAFYGTELDLQLRRRNIHTIILCGISTNIGVESTARDAYERGYQQIFVEDAMSARSTEEHMHTIQTLFPRIGLVRTTEQIIQAIQNENSIG